MRSRSIALGSSSNHLFSLSFLQPGSCSFLTVLTQSCYGKSKQGDQSPITYSVTRWWSRWEVLEQLLVLFGDVQVFLQKNDDLGPASRPKLLSIMQDQQKASILKIELATANDCSFDSGG